LRCDLDQYERLKHCSDKKDMTEWNEWRRGSDDDILLEGAGFSHLYLKGIELCSGHSRDPKRHVIRLGYFGKVYLKGAGFTSSNLQEANLSLADLEDTSFVEARLERAHFEKSNLKKANFLHAAVDGSTLFWDCKINKYKRKENFTDFSGVAINSARIDPSTKQLLEYNIRRKNWEVWYWADKSKKPFDRIETKKERCLRICQVASRLTCTFPIRLFWTMSCYGISTWRIIIWFLAFVVIFAIIYYLWGLIAPPGILDYLFMDGNGVKVASWLVPIRAIHFSVVVMTVGFTNMHANAHSVWAHILVSLQMILGFVLLAALVTRFAVLFTAGGPAGEFADKKMLYHSLKKLWNKIRKKN